MSYRYLLDIALILVTTKVFGLITKRFHMPQVVGALMAGLVFGPAVLGILHKTEFITQLAELGVIVIMFTAGMETNIGDLRKTGKTGFVVAMSGVLLPLVMGTGLGYMFNRGQTGNEFLENVFIGVVLTATSVSITVETLKEMGKLSTKVGNTILAAALIDDVLGLICLTMISSVGGSESVGLGTVLIKIVLFFVFAAAVGFAVSKLVGYYGTKYEKLTMHRFPILAFALCLIMAFCAEKFFGVADIIGAFAAGLIVGSTPVSSYIESRFSPLSYLLLTPIFFAGIGINIELPNIDANTVILSVAMIAVAIFSKLIGCGLGARLCGMKKNRAVQVGLGMICRGEVALVVANKGLMLGMMPAGFFSSIVLMVVLLSIATPVLLKIAFKSDEKYSDMEESRLADRYELKEQLDIVNMQLLGADENMRETKDK